MNHTKSSMTEDPRAFIEVLRASAKGNRRAASMLHEELGSLLSRHVGPNTDFDSLSDILELLIGKLRIGASERMHFYERASDALRHVLVDYAKNRTGEASRQQIVALDADRVTLDDAVDVPELDDRVRRLEKSEAEMGRVVSLRLFGRLPLDEIALAIGLKVASVSRDWENGRAILNQYLADTSWGNDSILVVARKLEKWQTSSDQPQPTPVEVKQGSHREREFRAQVRRCLADLPSDYGPCRAAAMEVNRVFHDELAASLQIRLQRQVRSMPLSTYAEKQSLASWVNGELRAFGLAIRCPKTGKPAILVADLKGSDEGGSRFRLEIREDDGRRSRTYSSSDVPELELMEDPPRREPFAKSPDRTSKRQNPKRIR